METGEWSSGKVKRKTRLNQKTFPLFFFTHLFNEYPFNLYKFKTEETLKQVQSLSLTIVYAYTFIRVYKLFSLWM